MQISHRTRFHTRAAIALLATALCLAHAIAAPPQLPEGKLPYVERPWTNDADKFSFAILGDKTSGGEGKWPIYDHAVNAINLLDPDFVITVGDQIPGHMEERTQWDTEWAEYMEHARRLEVPLFLAPGNHDIANVECYEYWKQDFGRTYYSFDYKGCHFLVLNTEEERFDGRGPVWEAMMTFAEADLASHAQSRHTFLFFHKPMWDDPRFLDDWARLERALGERRYTAVAGHEHYLMTERDGENLRVVQSATGGGIHLSDVKEYGCFHSFGFVTVDGTDTHYAVVEPESGIWPVEIAPTSFRRAVVFEMVTLDAEMPENMGADTAGVRAVVQLQNVLKEPVTLAVSIAPLGESGWRPIIEAGSSWSLQGDAVTVEKTLAPGERASVPLDLQVPAERLPYPPAASWTVKYKGETLHAEGRPMEKAEVVPIYPARVMREVPAWQVIGPFKIGPIDTAQLPQNPEKANPYFVKQLGPESGYEEGRVYDEGRAWQSCAPQRNGLLNFNGLMGTLDLAAAFASFKVQSPADQVVFADVYADNFAQVYVNGAVSEGGQTFGAPGGYVHAPIHLRAGWNSVVVKVVNNRGDWFLRFLIADPQGNLRFE
ncbi:MAG: metallophosphoesterase [Candidatus Hydrogenedentes bacterium]|nr:metallophosphoesterase [Candidatus Hydrogenedentota bacterium]